MESTANLWLSAAQSWRELSTSLAGCPQTEEYMQASLSIWRALFAPLTAAQYPEAKEPRQPSFDMIQAIMQVIGSGGLSEEMLKWLWKKEDGPGSGFEGFQPEAFRAWTDIYEKTVQPLLKIPRMGPAQVYHEKINRLTEKLNSYQTAVSEFQTLLSGPMEKSFADMKETLDRLGEKGEAAAQDSGTYYGMWIKVLENHYMSLLRSDEYRLALSRLLSETATFRLTGNDVLAELLEFLPIPTNKEIDELYKELYVLKKQTKEAAKKIAKMESALPKKDVP
jgi:hypothetical protein